MTTKCTCVRCRAEEEKVQTYIPSIHAESVADWDDIVQLNKDIQDFIGTRGIEVPTELVKLLSDLDWLIAGK